MKRPTKTDTKLVQEGSHPEDQYGIINPPVYHASTVAHASLAAMHDARARMPDSFVYGRRGTPTSFAFEEAVAALVGGDRTIAVNSGLSAICTAMLAFVQAGDHVLVCDNAYSPTRNFSENFLKRFGVETTYFDPSLGADVKQHFKPNTRTLYVESPGSHTFEVSDVPAIAEAAHSAGIKVVMDDTWSAGYFFKPFDHGVDVSVQAATKYLVGHSDAMLGAVTFKSTDTDILYATATTLGYHAAPDDAYLGLRGMRTLAARLKRHHTNAIAIAEWFSGRAEVKTVLHPALPSCPGHDIWKRDFTGSTGLFSVVFKPLSPAQVAAFVDGLELFFIGASWGGYESLVLPTNVTRTATNYQVDGTSIRFHIGLENTADLIDDLSAGLSRIA